MPKFRCVGKLSGIPKSAKSAEVGRATLDVILSFDMSLWSPLVSGQNRVARNWVLKAF